MTDQHRIVFVGEAWGADEQGYSKPFVGKSGVELYKMLCDAGFDLRRITKPYCAPVSMLGNWKRAEASIVLLNVFNQRPPDPENRNRSQFFFGKKADNVEQFLEPRKRGEYLLTEYAHHVEKLHKDLTRLRPNLIVALGATASWALGLGSSISKIRGVVHQSPWGKVLPTFHPASVIRAWDQRALVVVDLMKAKRENLSPDITRVRREIWTSPGLDDLERFWDQHLSSSSLIAVDIETERRQQISEVGFASDATHAIHIPFLFVEKNHQGKYLSCDRYWEDPEDEFLAWQFIRKVCTSRIAKVMQNGMYDTYWLWKQFKIPVRNACEDTMLLHHSLQPEMQKALGFLASIYSDAGSWKYIRKETKPGEEISE